MIRYIYSFLFIFAISSVALAQANNRNQLAKQSDEVVNLMSILSTDAFSALSYSQMFKACTQVQPVNDIPQFPKEKQALVKAANAIQEYFESLHSADEIQKSSQFHQCLDRVVALTGERGQVYFGRSLENLKSGKYPSSGLKLTRVATDWLIRDVAAGSPAALAGIGAGDSLIKVNDVKASTLSLKGIWDALQNSLEANTVITWKPKHKNEQIVTSLTNQVLTSAIEDSSVVIENMGNHLYIRVSRFDQTTLSSVLSALRAHSYSTSLIKVFDLRGNPGGLLHEAHFLLAIFGKNNPSKQWIATKYREGSNLSTFYSIRDSLYPRIMARQDRSTSPTLEELASWSNAPKWYVLLDAETASGAAWLAGSMQELNSAVLVGKTPDISQVGVDIIRPLNEKIFVKLPVAELAFPSGKVMSANSVIPDITFDVTAETIRPFPKNATQWKEDPLHPFLMHHFDSIR